MHARSTAALLVLATLSVACAGAAAATDAPPAVRAENATVDYSGEAVTLATEGNATVTGETSLEPGTNVSVIVRSAGENPFLMMDRTTVREDGRFVVGFDLSEVPDGANATLTVRGGGEQLTEAPVRLVAERTPTPTAEPTPEPTTVPSSSTASNTSSGDGPGFGALAAVVAALGTVLVLGRRR